ncbi:hypothetical protein B0H10DRAFT_435374 [Mycena sp. CBHHK59/15]|nr:hypothetical protein B0H10DRAFT_435374 [Mycena sp. CBHHK59/15]
MPGLPPLATIISIIQHRDIVSYFNIVASTAFIYDFCLTFGMEVDQIWSAQWTPLKVAYLLQRYLPFVDTVGISIYHGSAPGLTPAYCRSNYYATIFIDMISMIGLSELILTFRTWAVWRRDPKLGIALGVIFALFFGSTLTFGALFLRSMTFGVLPIPNFSGCLITGANNLLSGGWVLLMAYDLWMLILMAIPAVRSYRQGGHNHLLRVVYRDGIVYYIYLFGFSTANAVLNLALPKDLSFVLTP